MKSAFSAMEVFSDSMAAGTSPAWLSRPEQLKQATKSCG
jgi:hypothetical protein